MATKREKDFLHNLDKRMSVLEEVIKRLESNHLSHLQAQIDKIDRRVWMLIAGVVLQLISIVFICPSCIVSVNTFAITIEEKPLAVPVSIIFKKVN